MGITAPEELLGKLWNDVWRDGHFDVVDEIFDDPVIRHSPLGSETTARSDYKVLLREFQRTLARPETTIDDFAVSGDRIWTRATSRGVNRDTGDMTVVTWLTVMRVEAGRIAEQWATFHRGVDWEC
jgi:hypothetical protein